MSAQEPAKSSGIFKLSLTGNNGLNCQIEISGSESFIHTMMRDLDRHLEKLEPYLLLDEDHEHVEHTEAEDQEQSDLKFLNQVDFRDVVNQIMHTKYPISDIDLVLIAAIFVQHKTPKNVFSTRDISNLLKGANLGLKNPSHTVKLNYDKGFFLLLDHERKLFEVSESGIQAASDIFISLFPPAK